MSDPFGDSDNSRLTPLEADGLYGAFPGLISYGDKVAKRLPHVAAQDADQNFVSTSARLRQQDSAARLTGIRDPLDELHPIAVKLKKELARKPEAVPAPEAGIIVRLEAAGCTRTDRVLSYRGVPVPAGAAQIAYFIVLRFWPLFSPLAEPARVYRDDLVYDAAHVTDEMQESILLVSTRIYRDNLTIIQQSEPELFLAMWMREIEQIEKLCPTVPLDHLPPCYPRSRLGDQRECMMIVCDVMSEWERGFDLLGALRFADGVTRTSVRSALKSSTSLTQINGLADDTHRHIAGAFAHIRSVHSSMNPLDAPIVGDPSLGVVAHAFETSKVYGKQYRHVRWVAGNMPVRFFLGLEPAMLLPVLLIQMRESMEQHEGKFWLGTRGKQDACKGLLGTRLISLAITATSAICLPTARAMTGDNGIRRDSVWILAKIMPLIFNPIMQEQLDKLEARRDNNIMHDKAVTKTAPPSSARGDKDNLKSYFDGAVKRARLCSASIGEPGWTMGFRPDAWRQPDAEVEFLRKCCSYTLFSQRSQDLADKWNKVARGSDQANGADRHAGQI